MRRKKVVSSDLSSDLSSSNLFNEPKTVQDALSHWGKPSLIVLTRENTLHVTTFYWGAKKEKARFSDFAWGYYGVEPDKLVNCLIQLGLKIDDSIIASISDKDLPKVFEI